MKAARFPVLPHVLTGFLCLLMRSRILPVVIHPVIEAPDDVESGEAGGSDSSAGGGSPSKPWVV